MNVLAVECSTPIGSIAILSDDKIRALKTWTFRNDSNLVSAKNEKISITQHSEFLLPAIRNCLDDAQLKVSDINVLAVDHGPGRFTGIRIAVNCIKTFSYSLNLPIRYFSSLEILAQNARAIETPILCLLNAHKNMVYFQRFLSSKNEMVPIDSPLAIEASKLETHIKDKHLCLGDGFDVYQSSFSNKLKALLWRRKDLSDSPAAERLAHLATLVLRPESFCNWTDLLPLYIRASEAEEKLRASNSENQGLFGPIN